MNIALAITGSFCTHDKILEQLKVIIGAGHNVTAVCSKQVQSTDTRFGKAEDFLNKLCEITKRDVVGSIVETEPLGPANAFDVVVVAPCTGNTLAKLANGITDDVVTMTVKSHMRNCKPLVIGVSTNDALGLNMQNIAKLMNEKHVFFVPFGQDNPQNKPKSMVANWELLLDTILQAAEYKQIQPVIYAK